MTFKNLLSTLFFLLLTYYVNGQVGIGITTPVTNFQVHDSLGFPSILLSEYSSTSSGLELSLGFGEATINNQNGPMYLSTNNVQRINLPSTGKVGINTNPSNQLHIYDTSDPLRIEGLSIQSEDTVLVVDTDGVVYKRAGSELPDEDWVKDGDKIYNLNDTVAIGIDAPEELFHMEANQRAVGFLRADHQSAAVGLEFVSDSPVRDLRLKQYGSNYNILTTSGLNLSGYSVIQSGSGATGLLIKKNGAKPILFEVDAVERMRIAGDGKIGVGTGIPVRDLEVNGAVQMDTFYMPTNAGIGRVLVSDATGKGEWQNLPLDADWNIISGAHLQTGVPGNVGIGPGPVPSSRLQVTGSVSFPIRAIGALTYAITDQDYTIVMNAPGANVQLPQASSCPGRIYVLKFLMLGGAITPFVGDIIEGLPVFAIPAPLPGYPSSTITIQSDGVEGWLIIAH